MSKTITVYLSGPMYKSKEESMTWRNEIKNYLRSASYHPVDSQLLPPGILHWDRHTFIDDDVQFTILDPCNRWYDDKNALLRCSAWVVKIDKMEIEASDVVIVNGTDPGWGTPMEQYIAYISGKIVIAFAQRDFPSIWVKEHCHVLVNDHLVAAQWLRNHAEEIARSL
jgi:nucleoside 2-deoxyribosyltransferase